MSYRAAATGLVAWASLAAAACGPDLCGQRCGVAGECPSGFVCEGELDRCVPEDDRGACGGPLGLPEPPQKTVPPGVAGSAGTVGTDGNDGTDGGAGASPVGNDGVIPLDIQIVAPSDVCTGDAVSIELVAAGGTGALYHWQWSGEPGGLTPGAGDGARFTLEGEPASAGSVDVAVRLDDGESWLERHITLRVHERPRLASVSLPPLCPGEVVARALAAEGGDASSYKYTAAIDPALGLRLEGASLVGRFSAPNEAAGATEDAGTSASTAPSLALAVRDAYCEGERREIPIEVLPASECPQIRVSSADGPREALPPPCLGSEYAQAFVALLADATPEPTWREVASAPGLQFDAATRTLRGTPLGDGVVTLQVSDGRGRSVEADFPVTPREHCWLAYLAARDGAQRLQLFDARLSEQPAARRAYPAAIDDGDVLDFAFSPRGRFLSYRLASGAGPVALRLLDVRTWREQTLEFDGSVSAYAWSGSEDAGAVLAVAFDAGGAGALGGLVLAPAGVEPELTFFQPAGALVRSELFWFDGDRVAFLTDDPVFAAGQLFQSARFDAGAVSVLAPREGLEFFGEATLLPGARGIFVVDPSTSLPHFFAGDGAREVSHAADTLISPSGAFTARAEDGVLRVFRATDSSSGAGAPVWAQAEGCSALLAWARGRERIACAAAAGGSQRVAFFDLDPEQPQLVELARVQGDYRFLSEQHVGQPRLFAAGGRHFAFSTDANLYVVSLDGGAPHIAIDALNELSPTGPLQLSFSTRGQFLSVHAGDLLSVWNLQSDRARFARIPALVAASNACSEDLLQHTPSWCGSDANESVIRWSADEDLLVFRNTAGGLDIEDLSLDFPEAGRVIPVDDTCAEGCIVPGAYQFQR